MKFSFMRLHLFSCESKQSRCLIEWACPLHTPNSKIFISFWHSLKSQSGTKGALCLLYLFGYTYSSPLFTLLLQLLICHYHDRDIECDCNTHWCWPHTGRPDTDIFPRLGPIIALNFVFCRCWIFHALPSVCKQEGAFSSGNAHPLWRMCVWVGSLFGMSHQAITKAMRTFE